MISRVHGKLVRRDLGSVEVMTPGGVAYEIFIPLTVFERLPREGGEVELRTHHVVREDAAELFGFLDNSERMLFGRLLSASGVGPRLALNMLSTMTPDRLVLAITTKDIAGLKRIPGLGTKKAERLVLELADRLDDIAISRGNRPIGATADEAVGALVALGYNAAEASAAVRKALDDEGKLLGIDLIKAALAKVNKS
ncbi:MAG TPA: Holliday junction branch migration protein RuvA [Longimicrobiales bacterium]|nr:Holliday junction branch migration protein RuvA [Longimicrobiales bacterium]